jgi:integrase
MPGYVEDRWFTKRPDPETGEKRRTARYGQGKRYRVAGIPGVRDRSFERLTGPEGANAWLAKAQHESTKGEFIDPRSGNITLREYVEQSWWPALKADPATLETIRTRVWKHVLAHLGELPLREIKVARLRLWLKELDRTIGAGTAVAAWGYLSNILAYAVDDEKINRNPCKAKTIKAPTAPEQKARAWSAQRVSAVRNALHPHYQILVDIGVGAGLRQGEAFAIDVDRDIDHEAGFLHVRRQVKRVAGKLVFAPPKGDKQRSVPLPAHLSAQILAYQKASPPRSVTLPWKDPRPPETKKEAEERAPRTHRLLVTNFEGGAIRAWSFNQHYWKKALAAAGVIPAPPERPKGSNANLAYGQSREFGFHSLRHTYASVQLHARESVVAVSTWLGHGDAAITLRVYAHFMPEADGRGRDAMDAWFARMASGESEKISPAAPQLPAQASPESLQDALRDAPSAPDVSLARGIKEASPVA